MFRCAWRGSIYSRPILLHRSKSCYKYGLDSEEFKKRARQVVDFICEYNKQLACRPLIPKVKPGFLRKVIPSEPPQKPDDWDCIMRDTYEKILPGIVPWQHPRFFGFHPTGNSYASMLANWLSGMVGAVAFSWSSCPAYTELEFIVADWYAKAIGIPQFYLHERKRGGGVIQNTTSDGVLTALIAARTSAIAKLKKCNEDMEDSCLLPKLVAYFSKEAHSCVQKACNICLVNYRILESDEHCVLRGAVLEKAMQEDADKGLVPFFVVATLGTPSVYSCDNLAEIGPLCCRFCTWLHVEASYAGAAFICPEFRPLMSGIEYSNSFSTSPHQWLLIHYDCSLLYVKEKKKFLNALRIDPPYLQTPHSDNDFRNWTIPLSRRFRSIKLWFVMRDNGIDGIQTYIWNHCCLAKYFEELVKTDDRFQVVNDVWFGIVCFRLCGSDELNKNLLESINSSQEIFLTPTTAKCRYIIQFCVNYQYATQEDICMAWEIIKHHATKVLQGDKACKKEPPKPASSEPQNPKQLTPLPKS